MNRDEARQILMLFRPGTADANDPQVATALDFAKQDAELATWLQTQLARQEALRQKFRMVTPPAGLKEQIISEHAATNRSSSRRRTVLATAMAVALVMLCTVGWFMWNQTAGGNELSQFRGRMASATVRYAMDLPTSNMAQLRAFFAQRQAPADYKLPTGMLKAQLVGGALEKWHGANVSMVCFRTGKPLRPGESSDLWLFVADSNSIHGVALSETPVTTKVGRLMTATWTNGGKIYLLGVQGTEADIRAYL